MRNSTSNHQDQVSTGWTVWLPSVFHVTSLSDFYVCDSPFRRQIYALSRMSNSSEAFWCCNLSLPLSAREVTLECASELQNFEVTILANLRDLSECRDCAPDLVLALYTRDLPENPAIALSLSSIAEFCLTSDKGCQNRNSSSNNPQISFLRVSLQLQIESTARLTSPAVVSTANSGNITDPALQAGFNICTSCSSN